MTGPTSLTITTELFFRFDPEQKAVLVEKQIDERRIAVGRWSPELGLETLSSHWPPSANRVVAHGALSIYTQHMGL